MYGGGKGILKFIYLLFFNFFFPFYHNKIYPATNYNAIENKINKQDNTGHLLFYFIFFNKQNKTKTHTHIHTKKRQKKKTRSNYLLPAPSLFILNGVSISHMINGMPFL